MHVAINWAAREETMSREKLEVQKWRICRIHRILRCEKREGTSKEPLEWPRRQRQRRPRRAHSRTLASPEGEKTVYFTIENACLQNEASKRRSSAKEDDPITKMSDMQNPSYFTMRNAPSNATKGPPESPIQHPRGGQVACPGAPLARNWPNMGA